MHQIVRIAIDNAMFFQPIPLRNRLFGDDLQPAPLPLDFHGDPRVYDRVENVGEILPEFGDTDDTHSGRIRLIRT